MTSAYSFHPREARTSPPVTEVPCNIPSCASMSAAVVPSLCKDVDVAAVPRCGEVSSVRQLEDAAYPICISF